MVDATKKRLKEIFRGYKRMTPKLKSELEGMGLSVETGGKHVILRCGRRKTSLSISSSDRRSGLNITAQLIKLMQQQDRPSPDRSDGMER